MHFRIFQTRNSARFVSLLNLLAAILGVVLLVFWPFGTPTLRNRADADLHPVTPVVSEPEVANAASPLVSDLSISNAFLETADGKSVVPPIKGNGSAPRKTSERNGNLITSVGPLVSSILNRLSNDRRQSLFSTVELADASGSTARSVAEPEFSGRENEVEGEEPKGDHPEAALRFRQLQLQDENGAIAADGIDKARRHVNEMISDQRAKAMSEGKKGIGTVAGLAAVPWTPLGPGNIGGRIRTIVIDPTDPNKMWIGSVGGGIWKSTDAGGNWSPVDDFMANIAVSTIIIDPVNPNTMYAGTGESFAANLLASEGQGSPDGLRGDGVFKSNDGGSTWTRLTSTNPLTACVNAGPTCAWSYVNRLAISPDGAIILAATVVGIRRSSDGGATWTAMAGIPQNFMDIDFDPTDSSKAVAGGSGAIGYTTDGGATWSFSRFSTDGGTTFTAVITGRVEIAYAPSSPGIVYASVNQSTGAAPNQTSGEVFKSTDGGQRFVRVNMASSGNSLLGTQGGYDNIIWVNPMDPNFVVVGGVFAYRSTDGGVNWTPIAQVANGPPMHSDNHMIVADPGFNNTTNKTAYFSNDGGIFRADDISTVSDAGGWTSLNNGLSITQFYGAATNSAGIIVGGAQDNGTLRFGGDAQTWTKPFGGDGGITAADPTDDNYFYGEYINLGIFRSSDGGANFAYIYCNPVNTLPGGQPNGNGGPCVSPSVGITDAFNGANFIAPIILDPNESNRMLAGGLSLWRSNDIKASGYPTWTTIKAPVSNGLVPPSFVPISAISVSPNNSDFIVVGDNNGRIFLTFDGTSDAPTWATISKVGLAPAVATPARFVTRIVIDETRSPNRIYATYGGFSSDNIYRTTDLGATWTKVSGAGASSLPSVPIRSMVLNPVRPDYLYVGTEVGVFASGDAGATWQVPQFGPANVSVDDLFWRAGSLVAVTHGRGLFSTGSPVYSTNGGGGGTGISCPMTGSGYWGDPLTWPSGQVPLATDDVAIVCPIKVGSQALVRNLRVNSILTLNSSLITTEDIGNFGTIQPDISLPGNADINCRNLSNSGTMNNINVMTASGDVVNGGTININTLRSKGLRNAGSLNAVNVTVNGDFDNSGTMIGTGATSTIAFTGGPMHNFQGPGQTKFSNGVIQSGESVKLLGGITLDIGQFNVNGTMDFNGQTLNFIGNSYLSGGSALGPGTLNLAPTLGTVVLGGNAPGVNVASGLASYQSGGTFNGPLTVAPGATFRLNAATVNINGDATINGVITKEAIFGGNAINFFGGTFTNNGGVTADIVRFNPSGPTPLSQNIAGAGVWSGGAIAMGNSLPATPSTVTLQNDVTIAMNEMQISYSFNLNGHVLTYTGIGSPGVSVGGLLAGPGTFRMQPAAGTPIIRMFPGATWDAALKIASGTVRTNTSFGNLVIGGPLTVDTGATLRLDGVGNDFRGNLVNNGTINMMNGSSALQFRGSSFTNNGSIDATNVFFFPLAAQQVDLSGSGTWTGAGTLYLDTLASTRFTSDVTYGSVSLQTYGPLQGVDPSIFSVPCTVSWTGPGDVTGNIRRTNLAACPGAALRFGSPFTTITFDSGTPPSDVLVSAVSSPLVPVGFPNAVQRLYTITPNGGSGYSATLRLHYLDSELNGNDEAALDLWRFDGSMWNLQGATNRNAVDNWVEYSGVTQFSPWAISGPNAPTAAGVSISGRVRRADGNGISNATLTLSSVDGVTRSVHTSNLGYFSFNDVPSGATYVVSVAAKQYRFRQPSMIVGVQDDIADLEFVADPAQ